MSLTCVVLARRASQGLRALAGKCSSQQAFSFRAAETYNRSRPADCLARSSRSGGQSWCLSPRQPPARSVERINLRGELRADRHDNALNLSGGWDHAVAPVHTRAFDAEQ